MRISAPKSRSVWASYGLEEEKKIVINFEAACDEFSVKIVTSVCSACAFLSACLACA
jgi:hypothetical protein